MRIGLIAPPWLPVPPPGYGGTEMVVDLLATGLADVGVDVTLFAAGNSTAPVRTRSFFDAPPTPMGLGTYEAAHVIAAYRELNDVDLVHDHTMLGSLVGTDRVPTVVTNHGPFGRPEAELFRRAGKHGTVVAISEAQAADGRAAGVRVSQVIHHGLDIDLVPVGSGDGGFLLFLGRMDPVKGAATAIDLSEQLGIPLVLAGKCVDRHEVEYFEQKIRPRLGHGAEYAGEVGQDEKFELLGKAITLLNPITWPEPFGLVMVEALACGTPVVTTGYGAAPEIVDDGVTGFLCADRDQMATAISRVETLDRRGCRKAAEAGFSKDRMVERHLRLYEHLIRGGV
jgi:glycosyltransferase involved in cell wall biosynthesis